MSKIIHVSIIDTEECTKYEKTKLYESMNPNGEFSIKDYITMCTDAEDYLRTKFAELAGVECLSCAFFFEDEIEEERNAVEFTARVEV